MQDFPVYRKIDELLNNKIYPILRRFPKAETAEQNGESRRGSRSC